MLTSEREARDFVAARATSSALAKLERLTEILALENQDQNLVAMASLESVWLRHIADSAQLLDHVPRETGPWVDLGSGAGFPGLVISILDPAREVILVESRRLRIDWLNRAICSLGCPNCSVLGGDARVVEPPAADVISARALAPLNRLIAMARRFSTIGTHWVLPKGRSATQEVAALPANMRSMFHVKQSLTDPDAGIVIGMGKPE